MKKICLFITTLCICKIFIAQNIGIGTSSPNGSAMLDISSTTKGLLIPRMTTAQRNTIVNPATGLLIWQTDGTPGFYFYNGSAWTTFSASAPVPSTGWSTTGNSGTDSASNFIGTTDNQPLIGKVNGEQAFRISQNMAVTLMGYQAGKNNVGKYNTFYGYHAGAANTTGDGNMFIGHLTGLANTTGRQNTFIGSYNAISNTTGSYNQFIGFQAGQYNTTGQENTFNGYQSGQSNTSGNQNYFSGMYSGNNNTIGSWNHYEGYKAGMFNTTGYANYSSGYMAGMKNVTNYNHFTGYLAGTNTTTGNYNFFVGAYAGHSNTTGTANFFEGPLSGYSNIIGSGNHFSGYEAGWSNTASNNHFVGYKAGVNSTIGYMNHFSGHEAGYSNTTGSSNHFVGFKAGHGNTTGSDNFFEGIYAGISNTTGGSNHFSGNSAGRSNTTGTLNYYSGYGAGYNNVNGICNTFIGAEAGYLNVSGSSNVMLGFKAGFNETGSNRLYIANSSTTTPLIFGEFDNQKLTTNGNLLVKKGLNNNNPTLQLTEVSNRSASILFNSGGTSKQWKTSAYDWVYNIWCNEAANPSGNVFQLYSTGGGWLNGSLTESSDGRLKRNITTLTGALSKLKHLRGVTYNWVDNRKDSTEQIGFIAQEVERVFPQLVRTNTDGYKSVAYSNMAPVLIEAIKEQQQQIDDLKKEIEALKKQQN